MTIPHGRHIISATLSREPKKQRDLVSTRWRVIRLGYRNTRLRRGWYEGEYADQGG
jgi:hypothetical protein